MRGSWLTRDSGPCGIAEIGGATFEIEGWEIFEGDESSPHLCQGWFRCTAEGFTAPKDSELRLILTDTEGAERILDVQIIRVRTTDPEWEFRAER